jgi:HK97 family phage major capsid protein
MSKIKELREKAGVAAANIRALGKAYQEREQKREKDATVVLWPDNTRSDWDKANTEYDSLKEEIETLERSESISARMTALDEWENRSRTDNKPGLDDAFPGGEDETYGDRGFNDSRSVAKFEKEERDRRNCMRMFFAGHINGGHLITNEIRESCQRLNYSAGHSDSNLSFTLGDTDYLSGLQRKLRRSHPSLRSEQRMESRSMTKVGVGTGAEVVPITFLETLEMAMMTTAELFAFIDIMRTATGEQIRWPIGDDNANEGVQLAAEETDINALAQPDAALQQLTLGSYDFTSGIVKVSMQLSRDSLPNIDTVIAQMLGERLAKIKLRRATTGNGTTQPGGLTVQAPNGRTSALATAISPTDLIALQHSVDKGYRANARFMCHDLIVQALRLLNDSQNRPLWQSGLQDGVPDRLLGQGIITNNFMASTIATTNITMLYGDFRYYKAREVGVINLIKMVERFIERLQTGYMAAQSFDGRLQTWTNTVVAPVKRLTQA